MGPVKFIKDIAIPSMKGYTEDMDEEEYYSQPWEKGADELGGNIILNRGKKGRTNLEVLKEILIILKVLTQ